MIDKIKRLFIDFISSGLSFSDDLEKLRNIYLLNIILSLGSVFLVILGVVAFNQGNVFLGSIEFVLAVFLLYLFIFLRITKKHEVVSLAGSVIVGFFYCFLLATGGMNNTAYVWAFTYPLISLFLQGPRKGSIMSLALFVFAIFVFSMGSTLDFLTTYDTNIVIRFIPAYITIYLFSFVMEKSRAIINDRLIASHTTLENANLRLKEGNTEKADLIVELREKINEVKDLQGIVPICASCKKIRNDSGYWEQVEKYVQERSGAQFSHGICPDCSHELYGDLDEPGES